jgi:5-formyltetrahydrofolate cyclo-ligase
MLARRSRIPPRDRAEAGERLATLIARSDEFGRARRIVLYAALPAELPTRALAEAGRSSGRELLWPRLSAAGEIELAPADEAELAPDAAGIPAPPVSHAAVELRPGDLLIVPGVAFTPDGARLGRGGGHYDRLLARGDGCISIGIAFDIQVVEELPTEPHDRRVDIVATPTRIWRMAR